MTDLLLTDAAISGVVRLSHWGAIRASGDDARKFLQGQLTQDIAGLQPDQAHLAAFCNAKGRMQASFIAFESLGSGGSNDILLICSRDLLAQTLKRLSLFVMRAKVKLTDASDEFLLCGLAGTACQTVSAIYSGASCARNVWSKHVFGNISNVQLHSGADSDACVERQLWCAPSGTALPAGPALPAEIWHWLEARSGVAMITLPIFEAFVPQMLNYESVGGVNFKKGCYPGQEVVARSQFRGTLKRRAYVAQTVNHAGPEPHIGQEVFHESDAEQPCGLIAACGPGPSGGFAVIVSMQTSAATGRLALGSSNGAAIELLPLPYALLEDI